MKAKKRRIPEAAGLCAALIAVLGAGALFGVPDAGGAEWTGIVTWLAEEADGPPDPARGKALEEKARWRESLLELARRHGQAVRPVPAGAALSGMRRRLFWIAGCTKLSFTPGQSRSPEFTLVSTEVVEECDPPNPRSPGSNCRVTFGSRVQETLWTRIDNRPPGRSTEVFRVCLTGESVSAEVLESPFRYTSRRDGDAVVLTPEPRPPSPGPPEAP